MASTKNSKKINIVTNVKVWGNNVEYCSNLYITAYKIDDEKQIVYFYDEDGLLGVFNLNTIGGFEFVR